MEALMQADIKDLSNYFNKGHGLSRALTEHQNKGFLAKMLGKSGLKQQEKEDEASYARQQQTGLLMSIAENTGGINEALMKKDDDKKKDKGYLGIIIAGIAAPIVALVAFFKQLAVEFAFLKALTGKGLTKLFAPLKSLFTGGGPVGKAFAGIGRTIKAITDTIKTSKGFVAIGEVGTKIKGVVASLVKFMKPATDFFKSVVGMSKSLIAGSRTASTILKFASKFGTFLGKIFLPITILMSAFDFITGFMKGYEEGGILGGLEGGLTKLFQGLIGMPLDLLKKGVAWILGVFGFDKAKEWLNSFSFSDLIGDMISGLFDMIKGAVEWVKLLFSDPVEALQTLWTTLTSGFASLMDIIWSPIKDGIAWIMRLFGWDEAAAATEKFSIKTFILGVFTTVKDWIVGLFTWGVEAGKTPGDDTSWSLKTMIFAAFDKVKGWIKGLFTWASTDEKVEGEEEGWSIKSVVTDAIKTIVRWVGSLFTFNEGAAGIAAGIINIIYFIPNMVAKGILAVTTWLLKLFGFDETAEGVANPEGFSIGKMVVTAFTTVKDWIVGLFTWGLEAGKTPGDDTSWSLSTMITGVFEKVKNWLFGIFGFGTDEEGKDKPINVEEAKDFSLATMISNVVTKIKEYFWHPDGKSGLLQFDLMGALPNFELPDFGEMIKDVVRAVFPTSLFDKTLLGYGLKDFLPDSLSEFLTEPDKKLAAGGSFNKGDSVLVGELGPELILPSNSGTVVNAQRTQQIQQAGLQRGDASTAAPTIVNAPSNTVVDNKQSNTTNTTVSFSHPSPILNAVNVAA